jgi:ParB-like chromosome segregation protein Spo0J
MTGAVTTSVEVAPSDLGTSLCAVRLCVPEAQEAMQLSLSKVGQLTPVLAWRGGTSLEVFDGLKRWRAAQALSWPRLRVEVHELDGAGAKVRLLLCNVTAGLSDLEEAWVVRSLYREEKLDQPHIARLLGHDKSWVSRKVTLAEGLSDELTANVRLGLVSATAAVELARLQRCNQDAVAAHVIRRGLTTRQTGQLVERLLSAPQPQWPRMLAEAATQPSAPPAPVAGAKPKGRAPRRTPGEQLVADAWAMKRMSVRLQARLLERSLESLGESACAVVRRELLELRDGLEALTKTLDARLGTKGAASA